MDDLDYEKHLEHYKSILGYANIPQTNKARILATAEKHAQSDHAMLVSDALRDCLFRTTTQIAPKTSQ